MLRVAVLLALVCVASAETYLGYTGRWVEVEATAYSPHDQIDSAYHATKGRDRWMTAGRVSDVRKRPFGVAAPQPGGDRVIPRSLSLPLRTQVIIPLGNGYLDDLPAYDTPDERVFLVDDTGSRISRDTMTSRRMHIDLRVKTEADALAYNQGVGRHRFRIFVITGRVPVVLSPVPVQQPVEAPTPELVRLLTAPSTPACPPLVLMESEPTWADHAADLPGWIWIPWLGIVFGLFYIGWRCSQR